MDANVGVSGPDEVSPASPDLVLLLVVVSIAPIVPIRPIDDTPPAPLPPGGGLFVDGDLAIILLLPVPPAILLVPAPLPPPQAGLPAARVDDGVVVPPPALQEGLLVLVGGGVVPAVPVPPATVPLLDDCNLLGLGDNDPVDLIDGEAPAPDGILPVVDADLVGVVNLDDAPTAPVPAAAPVPVVPELLFEREATRGTLLGVVAEVGEDLNEEEDDDKLLPPARIDGSLAVVVVSFLVGVLDLAANVATLGRPR